ncbi:MAG: membrane protein insertion efficiency factor YidD [Paracoccaceae bacterium]
MAARAALWAIGQYRRHLSPRKGYGCAHRILFGGQSCSVFADRTITEHGIRRAISQIFARFAACRDAAEKLRAERERGDKRNDRPLWRDCDCGPCADVPDCGCL